MKRKIYVKLAGGIGNQLFQYSFAKNLSIELNAKLIIDDRYMDTWIHVGRRTPPSAMLASSVAFKSIFICTLCIISLCIASLVT